jgi:hypothetical protein
MSTLSSAQSVKNIETIATRTIDRVIVSIDNNIHKLHFVTAYFISALWQGKDHGLVSARK